MIDCANELQLTLNISPQSIWPKLIKEQYNKNCRSNGFTFFYNHMAGKDYETSLDLIDSHDPVIFILERKNILDQYLSTVLSNNSEIWVINKKSPLSYCDKYNTATYLKFKDFKYYAAGAYHWRAKIYKRYKDAKLLWYEDLDIGSVVEALGLPPEKHTDHTFKMRTKSKKELIKNFDEFEKLLKGTEDEWMLDN